jgi:hypothetical protein
VSYERPDWNALDAFEERGRILARLNPKLVADGLLVYAPHSADTTRPANTVGTA